MDSDRQRTQDDLRGIIQGDVFCDPVMTQLYASDASIYQVQPLGVVRPRSAADVSAVAQYAREYELSLHPRGAGSGVAGGALGSGLVIDFSRYMRRVEVSPDAETVSVQSGAALAHVNRALRPHRRGFGPDPVTRSITTMGGVLATNATGSHYLRSGTARDTIESMRVVTVDGEMLDLSLHEADDDSTESRLARGLIEIRQQFGDLIEQHRGLWPHSGYRVDDIMDEQGQVDLAKFMVGTQGTLGLIVDATIRSESIASHRGVVLLFYHRMDMAARSAVAALQHGLVACDLMDRRLLQIARDTDQRFAEILPHAAEAMVLLEIQGESLGELYDRLAIIKQDLCQGHDAAFASLDTVRRDERDLYWALSRRVIPRLYRFKHGEAPLPFIEDLTVPHDRLPEAVLAIQDTLKREHTTAIFFAHVGHGRLNLRPFLDLSKKEDRRRLSRLSSVIAEVVWDHGGHIGAAHAAGLSRSYLLPKQFGELWQAMGQVKRLFDPHHRLNPGKLFGAVLQKPNENLRPSQQRIDVTPAVRTLLIPDQREQRNAPSERHPKPNLPVLQHWSGNQSIAAVSRACNGCGRCRTSAVDERQCPVYRATRREEASPRAKANLLRGVISGEVDINDLAGEQAKMITDLCFNCHQCRTECPASVDIPKIVGELKAQHVANNGLPLSDALMGNIDTIARMGSFAPRLSNFLIANPALRWLAERFFGLSAARELPPISSESFLRHAARRRWNRSSPHGGLKVAYFVDQYANYHDPDIGRALAEILQQNGIGLYVPPNQNVSGMTRFTSGDLKGARRIAKRNTRVLSDAVRMGYTVLATEPSAVLSLKHEYPNLLDNEDAHLVARHSHEACEFFWNLHQNDRLSGDFQTVNADVAYHQPCHLRVLDPVGSAAKLLGLIPGIEVKPVEAGCTGMAGIWGLQKKNYRNSLRIGWPLISAMRAADVITATTECSACKMQIEHGAGQRTLHPIKILAYAYRRLPKIEKELFPLPPVHQN